jgi:outer membrane lipoprotein-sorting protein
MPVRILDRERRAHQYRRGNRSDAFAAARLFLPPQTEAMQQAMRKFVLVLVAFSAVLLGGAGQGAPPRPAPLSDQDKADLDRVSAYLNSIRSLRGDFTQIGPNGEIDQGRVYLEKPGRLRFEYKPPSPMLIVSDGRTVSIANFKLKTVDRYPLSSTPLGLILNEAIDLRRDKAILGVEREPGSLVVLARTSTTRRKPNISLTFSDPELELRQWTVIDDQGLATTVVLTGLEPGVTLNDTLFVIRDIRRPVGVKERD